MNLEPLVDRLPLITGHALEIIGRGELPASGAQTALADLVARYRQSSHMIVQEKNRQADGRTRAWIEETLAFLLARRQAVADEMGACLGSDAETRKQSRRDVAQGHRYRTSCFLLAGLPELGRLEKAQIAKLSASPRSTAKVA